jgi:hypothetical protein
MQPLSGQGRDSKGRFLSGKRHMLPASCQRPTLGKTWHPRPNRLVWCRECCALSLGLARQRYCSPRCRQRVAMRRYRSRKRGVPSERRRYRLASIPDGLRVVKRPYAEGLGAAPWWQQPDPGRAVLVPLTPELEDALVRLMHPQSGAPSIEGYRASTRLPLGWAHGMVAPSFAKPTATVPGASVWEQLLHDVLLGALSQAALNQRSKTGAKER